MRLSTVFLCLFSFFLIISCNNHETGSPTSVINRDSLMQEIKILSSDSFMGRKPFSEGETRTVSYLENTFRDIGLEPGNNGSYVQKVPLVEITPSTDSIMKVQAQGNVFTLAKTTDFVLATERTDASISLTNDELVFAGFGIVAPEYNWNDYAGTNVKGKVVLVMVNDPGFYTGDTTFFKGKTMTYYGRWTYKFEEAARQGAKACLIIHNTAAASYPFNVVQNSWGTSNLYLDTRGTNAYRMAMQGWISNDAASRLLQAAGKDTSLLATAYKPGFKAINLNEKLSLNMRVKAVYNSSQNVIGKITGSKRPNEYILYTAHWDHLGVGKPDENGDSVYNGAIDNASGTAALIEIARAFKKLDTVPERTVLFLSVTAEEQGLLGSAYYAENPVYPLGKTVCDINMDGVNAHGKTKDVVITGQGQSGLEDYFIAEATKQGRYVAPEAHPEGGHYFRSDHFNFAKKGVPSLSAGSGIDDTEKGKDYGKQLDDDYTANRYHRPADEYDSSWSFAGGLQDLEIFYNIGRKLAFETGFPQWKNGSEFKAIREKELQ